MRALLQRRHQGGTHATRRVSREVIAVVVEKVPIFDGEARVCVTKHAARVEEGDVRETCRGAPEVGFVQSELLVGVVSTEATPAAQLAAIRDAVFCRMMS